MAGGRTAPRALRRGEIIVIDPRPLVAQGIATAFDPAVSRVLTMTPAAVDDVPIARGLAVVGSSTPEIARLVATLTERDRRVIVYGIGSPDRMAAVVDAGAMGVVPEDADAAALREAADTVRSGGVVYPPDLLAEAPLPIRSGFDPFRLLTPRESAVLRSLLAGLRPGEIAERDFVSAVTVRNQVQSILTKLDVHSQLEAVAAAHAAGWRADAA